MKPLDELVRHGHLGLAGMLERASLLNGHLDIKSNPQTGTTITLHLPVRALEKTGFENTE